MDAIFPVISNGVAMAIEWMGDWMDALLGQPVLVFFCIALPLLTLGLTIIKRLLSVRA